MFVFNVEPSVSVKLIETNRVGETEIRCRKQDTDFRLRRCVVETVLLEP
jgi:hypothetical protein